MTWLYWFIRVVLATFFRLFYRLKVYGLEHLVEEGALICPNHVSYLDPPLVTTSWPHEVHFLARANLFEIPLLGALIRKLNAHPIQGESSNLSSFKMVGAQLKKGRQVVIFPEGARSYDGELGPIKPGVGMLAMRYHCPVIPMYIAGAYEVMPRGSKFPKPWGKITCVFGSPIDPDSFCEMEKKEAQKALTEQLSLSIRQLKQWLEEGAVGNPP